MKFLKALIGGRTGGQEADEGPSVTEIVASYEAVLRKTEGEGRVRRLSDLPFDKPLVKRALLAALEFAPDAERRHGLEAGLMALGDFQDAEACERRGLTPDEARARENRALLAELRTR